MFRRLATALALIALAACSSDAATSTPSSAPTTTMAVDANESVVDTASAAAPGPAVAPPVTDEPPASTEAVTTAPVAVTDPPQTGVPGDAADDALCSSYGLLLTTEYLVGLVEAFGDEAGARRAEAMAASTLLDAVGAAAAALGAEAAGSGLDQRWAAAVARATTALESGLDPEATRVAWAEVLATHDRNDPELVVELDAASEPGLAAAAGAIESTHGPLVTDESYLAALSVTTPTIDARLQQRCPDVAVLLAGDAV